jgi:hypothetical protein
LPELLLKAENNVLGGDESCKQRSDSTTVQCQRMSKDKDIALEFVMQLSVPK